jgi:hypothetical protein
MLHQQIVEGISLPIVVHSMRVQQYGKNAGQLRRKFVENQGAGKRFLYHETLEPPFAPAS